MTWDEVHEFLPAPENLKHSDTDELSGLEDTDLPALSLDEISIPGWR